MNGNASVVIAAPNSPVVAYSSTYTGRGTPTAATLASCAASPIRTTTTEVDVKMETTFELVELCVGVGVGVALVVPV